MTPPVINGAPGLPEIGFSSKLVDSEATPDPCGLIALTLTELGGLPV